MSCMLQEVRKQKTPPQIVSSQLWSSSQQQRQVIDPLCSDKTLNAFFIRAARVPCSRGVQAAGEGLPCSPSPGIPLWKQRHPRASPGCRAATATHPWGRSAALMSP